MERASLRSPALILTSAAFVSAAGARVLFWRGANLDQRGHAFRETVLLLRRPTGYGLFDTRQGISVAPS